MTSMKQTIRRAATALVLLSATTLVAGGPDGEVQAQCESMTLMESMIIREASVPAGDVTSNANGSITVKNAQNAKLTSKVIPPGTYKMYKVDGKWTIPTPG